MEDLPKKIHIIGPSGTGKTTLAKYVSEAVGSPLIELDPIVWPTNTRRTNEHIKPILEEVLNKGGWVTEGIFISGVEMVFDQADQIVWIDLPLRTNLTRITGRFIKNKLTGKDHWGLISFLKLARGTIGYSVRRAAESSGDDGDITPAILENLLRPYQAKLVRIRNTRDYGGYLERFKRPARDTKN